MQFRDIIGQEGVKAHLRQMCDSHRLAHATLLVGPEGAGALPLAVAFAQYVNCTGDKSGGDSCGSCPSCVKFRRLMHPDLHFIYPTINRGDTTCSDMYSTEWRQMWENATYFSSAQWATMMGGSKQAVINKNDAVAIHQKLSLRPFEADYQILILWKPELMNETSANRILKIMEEPPERSLFIVVSENSDEILPTILSRTQMIKVPPVDEGSMKSHLMAKYGMDEEGASRMAHIANGNVISMMQMAGLAQEDKSNLEAFMSMMRTCYTRNVMEMRKIAEQSSRSMSRDQAKDFFSYSLRMVRENFIMNLGEERLNYMTPEEEAFSQRFSRFIHVGNVLEMADLFDEAVSQLEQNGNTKIILMDVLLQLTVLLKRERPE